MDERTGEDDPAEHAGEDHEEEGEDLEEPREDRPPAGVGQTLSRQDSLNQHLRRKAVAENVSQWRIPKSGKHIEVTHNRLYTSKSEVTKVTQQ